LLKNLQLSKTVNSRDEEAGGNEHRLKKPAADQAHQSSKRILIVAGVVALAVLMIIGLAAALNVFDCSNRQSTSRSDEFHPSLFKERIKL
jgi:hypothetical protein